MPTAELDTRIEEELEGKPSTRRREGRRKKQNADDQNDELEDELEADERDNIEEYLQDDYAGYKMQGDGRSPDEEEQRISSCQWAKRYMSNSFLNLGYLKLR